MSSSLESVFDASHLEVYIVDADSQKFLYANQLAIENLGYWDFNEATNTYFVDSNWLAMLGLKPGTLKNDPEDWQRLIHPEDFKTTFETVERRLSEGETYSVEFRMQHKEGHYVWIQSIGAVVAWDSRTNNTSQLLTFAKGGDPVKQDISLTALIRETVAFDLSGCNVKLELEADDKLWIAKVDKGQISQAFPTWPSMRTRPCPVAVKLPFRLKMSKWAVTRSRDCRRAGISWPVLPTGEQASGRVTWTIFLIPSTAPNRRAVGLSTVYSIINKHGGTITVDSILGKGTSFQLYLPASTEIDQPEEEHGVREKAIQDTGKRVLVMDDEEMICDLAKSILGKAGYRVDFASDGEKAIAKYKQSLAEDNPIDCIIMDLTIPGGLGGEEAVKEILALNADADVIVSSGYAVDPVMANYADYGFKGVITKPFTMQSLKDEVGRLVN